MTTRQDDLLTRLHNGGRMLRRQLLTPSLIAVALTAAVALAFPITNAIPQILP